MRYNKYSEEHPSKISITKLEEITDNSIKKYKDSKTKLWEGKEEVEEEKHDHQHSEAQIEYTVQKKAKKDIKKSDGLLC